MSKQDEVARSLEERQRAKMNIVTLSSGVTLAVKRIPISLLVDITARASEGRPTPPKFKIEGKEIWEENYSDPTYLANVKAFETQMTKQMNDAFLLLGSSLNSVPKGVAAPDSTDWMDGFDTIGLEVPKSKKGRYLMWLKSVAIVDESDFRKVFEAIQRLSGVTETDVDSATERFPSSS